MAREDGQQRWALVPIHGECAATRQTISADLDGEANEFEQAAARKHRSACPECDRFAEQITRATAEIRSAPALEAGRRLVPATGARRLRLPLAFAGSAAALAIAALLGFVVSSRVNTPPSAPPPAELRLANADTRSAQAELQRLRFQELLGLPKNDPLLDHGPRRTNLIG
jgi:hypothetical protein